MDNQEESSSPEVRGNDDKEQAREPAKAPLGFVKGGTPTSKSEQLFEERFQQAEARRDVSAQERAAASIPVEEGGAQLLSNQFTRHPEIPKAYVLLQYVSARGEPTYVNGEAVFCCADIIIGMDPLKPTELALVLVCPRCSQRGVKHLQDCQMTIRQSNKHFELRTGMGPQTFVFQGATYRSAGMITESESFRCPDCDWRARINMNRVWPD